MRKLLAFLLACAPFAGCRTTDGGGSEVKFFGADSQRARLTFETDVLYSPKNFSGNPQNIYQQNAHKAAIDEVITSQLQHMFSSFVNHTEPFNYVPNPGIPRDRPTVKVLSTSRDQATGKIKVHYSYSDITVFQKSLFKGKTELTMPFLLPKDPVEIYGLGLMPTAEAREIYTSGDDFDLIALENIEHAESEQRDEGVAEEDWVINTCTDLHYWSEGDYWYFWHPHQKGCQKATADATIQVTGKFVPMASTTNTYPRYKKLYGDNGNGADMTITFLVGIDEDFKKADLGRQGFEKDFRMLTEGKKLLTDLTGDQDSDILLQAEADMLKGLPDFKMKVVKNEPRLKTMSFQKDGRKVTLNMHLVDPGTDEFVTLSEEAMKTSDVFIYDGHSGLGGHLAVDRIFTNLKTALPKDKYQIFMFNGCSTFSYYNYDYFQLKKQPGDKKDEEGFKGLDIITSATPAAFSSGPATDYWIIRALASGDRPNWQKIMTDVMKIAGSESALLHVNGDEDNPSTPDGD